MPAPTLRVERRILRSGCAALAASDEVGRGALSGPATVGMVLVTAKTRTAPVGVRDSKLLTAQAREALVPRIQRWAAGYSVGHASAAEIDDLGIIAALRLAGHRAIAALPLRPEAVLLDGSHDYLTPPGQTSLFDAAAMLEHMPPVITMVKADLQCAAVAAASVLAKTARDAIMIQFAQRHPQYGWQENKGYASPEHIEALQQYGPTPLHRVSWRLPGLQPDLAAAGP